MKDTNAAIAGLSAILLFLFFFPLISVCIGAFAGWVVGIFFADTFFDILQRLGMNTDNLAMWQIGAFFGFVGGFLKTTVSVPKK